MTLHIARMSFGDIAALPALELEELDSLLWEMVRDVRAVQKYRERQGGQQ